MRAIGLKILNIGQVTRKTPELAPPSPIYNNASRGILNLDRFNVHRSSLHGGSFSGTRTRTHGAPVTSSLPPRPCGSLESGELAQVSIS
ncbi:hypothetical protein TNCV_4498331 [Trichonephila clavipes]|nr:hypothetical protein TNCV_4498331 [Trichonephila clavipes]